ncbi:MAG: hypothetical protein ACOCYA_06530, partial [Spirochaetota bacterium]
TTSAGRLFDAAAALLGLVDVAGYEGEGPIKMEWAALRYARDRGLDSTAIGGKASMPGGFILKRTTDSGGFLGGFPGGFPGEGEVPSFVLDPLPVLEAILSETDGRSPEAPLPDLVGNLSYRFHEALAGGIVSAVGQAAAETGLRTVCLGGGVFLNMLLKGLLLPALRRRGFRVFLNRNVSPGDGGIALGQVYFRVKRGV